MEPRIIKIGIAAVVIVLLVIFVVIVSYASVPSHEDNLPITDPSKEVENDLRASISTTSPPAISLDGISAPMALIPPRGHNNYTIQGITTFQLRDDWFSWSGNDQSIYDVYGRKWFEMDCAAFSMNEACDLKDELQNIIASYRKKIWTTRSTRYITIPKNGVAHVLATIRTTAVIQMDNDAHVYLHQPTVPFDDVSDDNLGSPYIRALKHHGWNGQYYSYIVEDAITGESRKIAESSADWSGSRGQRRQNMISGTS